MLSVPANLPPGTHYVRLPVSKSACMRILLELVQRGSRYWTGGVIPASKALRLAEKFADLYGTDASQGKRAWNKAKGISSCTLVMYPEDDVALTPLRWWLLVTPGTGPVWSSEQLRDAGERRQRLAWGEQYELVHLQRERAYGGGRSWTWGIRDGRCEELRAAIIQYASAHGGWRRLDTEGSASRKVATDRTDDLLALIGALERMPGFHGVRMQMKELFHAGEAAWRRTHAAPLLVPAAEVPRLLPYGLARHSVIARVGSGEALVSAWPKTIPYVDKSFTAYHRPPLRLDILVALWEYRQRG